MEFKQVKLLFQFSAKEKISLYIVGFIQDENIYNSTSSQ